MTRREFLRMMAGVGMTFLLAAGASPATPTPEVVPTVMPSATTAANDPFNYGNGLDEDRVRLSQETGPVVCLVDTLHPSLFPQKLSYVNLVKMRASEISGLPCLVIHYTFLAQVDFAKCNIKALIIDNAQKSIERSYTQALYRLIRETAIPAIGFCGGMHHIVRAYGGTVGAMRKLKPGEPDQNPEYHPGFFKEWGFKPVRVVKRDPLWENLANEIVVRELHYAECKKLPNDFDVLASTDECQAQAIKHKTKLLYGTQFHPEHYDEKHLNGKTILQNFFALAIGQRKS